MDRETWLRFYEKAEPSVQDYLLSPLSAEQEDKAQTELGLDNDVWDRIMDAVWELVFLKLDKQAFADKITKASTERDSDEAEKVVLRDVVYPLADLVLWDVDSRLQELGADMKAVQNTPRISLRPVSYGAAARRIASNARISILNEETVRKLRDVLISYLKGVRTKEQVLEILQRSQGEGGLGFELSKAELYLDEMMKFFSTTQVMSEEEYAAWYRKYLEEEEQRAEKIGSAPEEKTGTEEAVPAEAAVGLEARPMPKTNNTALNEAMEGALTEIGSIVEGEYLQHRLQNLVSTRMRGVRNKLQVLDVLKRPEKVGGLHLQDDVAEKTARIIEKYFQDFHQKVTDFEKQKISQVQEMQKTKIAERRMKDAEEHEAWYRAQTERTNSALRSPFQTPDTYTGQGIPGAKQADLSEKNNMRDIQPPIRLTGLDEELGNMDLQQFRRLSGDPNQAAQQILKKLDTLKQESFDAWTNGVTAWRQSPLQQVYLTLVAESFTKGKTVTELVEEKKGADGSLPTAEEIGTLIDLNSKIQLS